MLPVSLSLNIHYGGLVLKPPLVCLVNLSRRILLKNHSSLDNRFSFVGSKPLCNSLLYSKALKYFSQWSSSTIPAAEKAPHRMTPLPPCCGRDSWASPCNSCFIVIHYSTYSFSYSAKNVILWHFYEKSEGYFNSAFA